MLCKKVSKLLSEFFDGVLDADMSARVSQHLKRCEKCRKELDIFSILHGRVSRPRGAGPPRTFPSIENTLP